MAPLNCLPFRCPHCPFEATSQDAFRAHAWNGHLSLRKSDDAKFFFSYIYICSECSISSTEVNLVKLHTKTDHPDKKPSVLTHSMRIDIDENILEDNYNAQDNKYEDNSSMDFTTEDMKPTLKSQLCRERSTSSPTPLSSSLNSEGYFNFNGRASSAFSTSSSGSNVSTPPRDLNQINHSQNKYNHVPHSTNNNTDYSNNKCTGMTVHSSSSKHPLANSASNPHGEGNNIHTNLKSQDWSRIIARSEKKFVCLLCRQNLYNGRTEVVFHAVTRHLLKTEIVNDLSHFGCLSGRVKRVIGRLFVDGMRIRSGVHYKDAERVEAALFRSIELHLRYRDANNPDRELPAGWRFDMLSEEAKRNFKKIYTCTGCQAKMPDSHLAFAHINDELRAFLPEFMRARSCPWSLSSREEWVWTVPDCPSTPVGETSQTQQQMSALSGDPNIQNEDSLADADVYIDPLPSPEEIPNGVLSSLGSSLRPVHRHARNGKRDLINSHQPIHNRSFNSRSQFECSEEMQDEHQVNSQLPNNLKDFYRGLLSIMAAGGSLNNLNSPTDNNLGVQSNQQDESFPIDSMASNFLPNNSNITSNGVLFDIFNGHVMNEESSTRPPMSTNTSLSSHQPTAQTSLGGSGNISTGLEPVAQNSIALALAALNRLMPNSAANGASNTSHSPFPTVVPGSQTCAFNAASESSSLAR